MLKLLRSIGSFKNLCASHCDHQGPRISQSIKRSPWALILRFTRFHRSALLLLQNSSLILLFVVWLYSMFSKIFFLIDWACCLLILRLLFLLHFPASVREIAIQYLPQQSKTNDNIPVQYTEITKI